jgi:hypothetical protein
MLNLPITLATASVLGLIFVVLSAPSSIGL